MRESIHTISENVCFVFIWKGLWTILDYYIVESSIGYEMCCIGIGMLLFTALQYAKDIF